MFKLSKYFISVEIPIENSEKLIIYSLRTGASFIFSEKSYSNIINEKYEQLTDDEIQILTKNKILILDKETEINSILDYNKGSNEKKDSLSFTIQPTSNCQLGCFYCGQEHKKDKISEEVITKTIDRIKYIVNKNVDVKYLHITWYGGEPLMAISAVEKYSQMLIDFCQEKNIFYSADMITNGVLFNEKNFLKMLNLKITAFQITIDGTKKTHDLRRITKGGSGTFDLIFENVIKFVNSPFYEKFNARLNLRINIDKTMVDEVDNLIDMVYEKGILNKINISFAPVFDWGGNKANANSLTHNDFAQKEIEWLFKLHQLGKNDLDLIPNVKSLSCMVEDVNSEVYDAYGNIMACYEYTYTPVYQNNKYIEGNVLKDIEKKEETSIRNWRNDVINKTYSECIECKFYPVCAGECPKQWISGHIPCPSYKFNIEDRLLIQFLNNNLE